MTTRVKITFNNGHIVYTSFANVTFREFANDFVARKWVCYDNALYNTEEVIVVEELHEPAMYPKINGGV